MFGDVEGESKNDDERSFTSDEGTFGFGKPSGLKASDLSTWALNLGIGPVSPRRVRREAQTGNQSHRNTEKTETSGGRKENTFTSGRSKENTFTSERGGGSCFLLDGADTSAERASESNV